MDKEKLLLTVNVKRADASALVFYKDKEKLFLTVNIKIADESALVYYKQDGRRFENERTIKMKIQTSYKIILTFRPPQKINSVYLRGELLDVEKEEVNEESSKYTLSWDSSNIGITKKNKRERFPIILDVQNVGTLELELQFKFYGALDTDHSAWGKCLHQIDYICCHKPGNSFIEILSETYR